MSDGAQAWYIFSFFKDSNTTGIEVVFYYAPLLGIIKINTNHNHSKKLILTEISCYFCLPTTCNEKSFPSNFRVKNKQFLLINATFWNLVNLHEWYHDRQNFSVENPSFSTLRTWFSLKPSNLQQHYIQIFRAWTTWFACLCLQQNYHWSVPGKVVQLLVQWLFSWPFAGQPHDSNTEHTDIIARIWSPWWLHLPRHWCQIEQKIKYTSHSAYRSLESFGETSLCV